ncbi:hypothetical protein [uncultured Clostridium sp.]|uniref:hypothetical protein n=1 Tax=uncultured Clostridium sp. TaxID=59620 RepID=UPI00273107A9|nr:hypothetical protein [uncultured Clostridium sp.]
MKNVIIMTQGIKYLMENQKINESDLLSSLSKFTFNDWGILSNEDKEFQKELLKIPNSRYTERLMGVYVSNKTKIWIISEYDYSIKSLLITILLPEEY